MRFWCLNATALFASLQGLTKGNIYVKTSSLKGNSMVLLISEDGLSIPPFRDFFFIRELAIPSPPDPNIARGGSFGVLPTQIPESERCKGGWVGLCSVRQGKALSALLVPGLESW